MAMPAPSTPPPAPPPPPSPAVADIVQITVQAANGDNTLFRARRNTRFGKIFQRFAELRQLGPEGQIGLRFLLDGQRLKDDDTAEKLGIYGEVQVDAVVTQTGGA